MKIFNPQHRNKVSDSTSYHHHHHLMKIRSLVFQLFYLVQTFWTASPHKIPRLSPFHKETLSFRKGHDSWSLSADSNEVKTYYYTQTLDHFNYAPQSYANFRQKYVVISKYWGGPISNSPIFAYLGAEDPLDDTMPYVGFLRDVAPHFKSLSVYIEHRFYGESVPFGTFEEAMKNETTRGYFNSAQALADYAQILLHIKDTFSAHNSPIIVVGGSYGGKLASWFRLKYPHIAVGALASSAPILYFDNITPLNGYYSTVTKDFKEVSQKCYETIRKSWDEIDKLASQPGGLSILSRRFNCCSHLNSSRELKDFLDSMYSTAAQYDYPPEYPVTIVCEGIDGAPAGTDIVGRIFAGAVSYLGNRTCYDTDMYNYPSQTYVGWAWQTCSEMVMAIGRGENDTMFPPLPFNLHQFIQDCNNSYGVTPRPHWITTYYGGHDIKLVLKRFGSNIIFSNGLRDPYSTGGVLEDLSESIVALTTRNGSHCLDILPISESDPEWLKTQRKTEVKIIEGWLQTYNDDQIKFKELHSPARG